MRFFLVNILLLLYILNIQAISVSDTLVRKQMYALRVDANIKIDGQLNEADWKNAENATDFTTSYPTTGSKPIQNSEVRVLYDASAVYIGAKLFDSMPDSIRMAISTRDYSWALPADKFWVLINPFDDGQNIFQFEVSASNCQKDIKISSGVTDINWNAVWQSQTHIDSSGWYVEMRIPYMALRFPVKDDQRWAVNFGRNIYRNNESSYWQLVDRNKGDNGSQAGLVLGISNIKQPFRLIMFPYVSGYVQNSPDGNSFAYSAGMDLQYGINEAYTLDMTLIPDFGQRKSDYQVLNLSPFEIKYGENRQFFQEGIELFNKAGLFYSRRVGAKPSKYYAARDSVMDGDKLLENPEDSKMINAFKITGRGANGTALGIFNAVTTNTYAVIKKANGTTRNFLTEPGKNYNMLVYDMVLNKYSYLNLINTNVYQPFNNNIANVIGSAYKVVDKNNKYGFWGKSALSYKTIDNDIKNSVGSMLDANVGRLSGSWVYNYNFKFETDKYNPNDLGYLQQNNSLQHGAFLRYQVFNPTRLFLNWNAHAEAIVSSLYNPNKYSWAYTEVGFYGTFTNYSTWGFNLIIEPFEKYDFYEPRVKGRYFTKPKGGSIWTWASTDYRKPITLWGSMYYYKEHGNFFGAAISPGFKINDQFSLWQSVEFNYGFKDKGFVNVNSNDSIVFGLRNNKTISATISGTYVFNNSSSLNLNIRHYWSMVDYSNFYLLQQNGNLSDVNYSNNSDINFNTLNVDLTYSWNFAPGSFLNLMWKNSILSDTQILNNKFQNYFRNVNNTLSSPQTNTISVKISYYLDYRYLIKVRS